MNTRKLANNLGFTQVQRWMTWQFFAYLAKILLSSLLQRGTLPAHSRT